MRFEQGHRSAELSRASDEVRFTARKPNNQHSGLSWQVVPARLLELLGDPDPERSQRAFNAMMSMTKIDLAAVEAAVSSG